MTHVAKVLALLSDGQWHSYREGYAMNVMLHSRVADLRKKGYDITCAKRDGGYWYRLLSKPDGGEPRASFPASPLDTRNGAPHQRRDDPSNRVAAASDASPPPETLFDLPTEPAWA